MGVLAGARGHCARRGLHGLAAVAVTDLARLRDQLADAKTRNAAALEIGDWMRALCLLMGTEFRTACIAGVLFATGIERDWSKEA